MGTTIRDFVAITILLLGGVVVDQVEGAGAFVGSSLHSPSLSSIPRPPPPLSVSLHGGSLSPSLSHYKLQYSTAPPSPAPLLSIQTLFM